MSDRGTGDNTIASDRRTGDAIAIPGDYQYRALHEGPPVQRYWHRVKLELLDWLFPIEPGERVLEVGCGSGVFADAMASRGAEVTAIDANAEAVAFVTKTFVRPGLRVELGLLDDLAFPDASFDGATCLEVLEHVYVDQATVLLATLRRVLRPGGRVLITTPNYRGLWPAIEWGMDRFSAAAHMQGDQHVTRFHRRSLEALLEGAGFEIAQSRTFSTVAPFLAPLSLALAGAAASVERRVSLPFGNILAVVAQRR